MAEIMRGKKHAREDVEAWALLWDKTGIISAPKSDIKGNTIPVYLETLFYCKCHHIVEVIVEIKLWEIITECQKHIKADFHQS